MNDALCRSKKKTRERNFLGGEKKERKGEGNLGGEGEEEKERKEEGRTQFTALLTPGQRTSLT